LNSVDLLGREKKGSGITLAGLFFCQQQALALRKNLRRLANCPCIKLRRNKINQNVQHRGPGHNK